MMGILRIAIICLIESSDGSIGKVVRAQVGPVIA